MSSETTFIVVRVGLEDSQRSQVAISQTATNLDLISHMLKEVKLMSMLIFFTRWVRIVEDTVKGVILKLVYTGLPGTKHRVGSRVRLLPFKSRVVNILINFQNSVLGHLRVRLHLGSTDSHSKSNF